MRLPDNQRERNLSTSTDAQAQSALHPIVIAVTPTKALPDSDDQVLSFQSRGTIPLFQMRERDVIRRQNQLSADSRGNLFIFSLLRCVIYVIYTFIIALMEEDFYPH